jgi:hypothetical protein
MAVVYVVGLPASLLYILWRRRDKLFGERSVHMRATYGFLYEAYGPTAWWWEVEELIRKLLLSAVVVLIDAGSPLQVTLAVLVCGWAHVLHAIYKPWGVGDTKYQLQHGSLFVTSFVFLMGLLFKVNGVSTASPTYRFLSYIMLLFSSLFISAWLLAVATALLRTLAVRNRRVAAAMPLVRTLSARVFSWYRRSGNVADVAGVKLAGPADSSPEGSITAPAGLSRADRVASTSIVASSHGAAPHWSPDSGQPSDMDGKAATPAAMQQPHDVDLAFHVNPLYRAGVARRVSSRRRDDKPQGDGASATTRPPVCVSAGDALSNREEMQVYSNPVYRAVRVQHGPMLVGRVASQPAAADEPGGSGVS